MVAFLTAEDRLDQEECRKTDAVVKAALAYHRMRRLAIGSRRHFGVESILRTLEGAIADLAEFLGE